jgi:hypothetical protein
VESAAAIKGQRNFGSIIRGSGSGARIERYEDLGLHGAGAENVPSFPVSIPAIVNRLLSVALDLFVDPSLVSSSTIRIPKSAIRIDL